MKWPWPRLRELRIAIPVAVPLFVLSVFVLRGCDTPSVPIIRPPEGAVANAGPTTSAPENLTGIKLASVGGTTVPNAVRATGTARLSGSVVAPQGLVPGATVRVEHLVLDKPAPTDIFTAEDGRWDLPNIAGGRYRVRAFLPPTYAQVEPQVFFLNDGEQRNLDLNVENFPGVSLAAAIAPDPPQLNQPFNLVIRVLRRTVDADGVVRSQPIVNANVALTGAAGYNVRGPNSLNSDLNGDATFSLECRVAGAAQVQATVRATPVDQPQPSTLAITPCEDPRATSTTAPPASSSTTTTLPNQN